MARELRLYSGSANPILAEAVAQRLELALGRRRLRRFGDGEVHVQLEESARGADLYLIQSTQPPVNENLMELLVLIDTCRRAGADSVTAVIPYYGYSRQDKKTTGREPITAKLVANLLVSAGANRVVSVDLHNPAIQGFFDIGMDHLTAVPLLADRLREICPANGVIVAPDLGRLKLADAYSRQLGLPLAVLHKRRLGDGRPEVGAIVGEVEGRQAVVVDDIIATAGTITAAVKALLAGGAEPPVTVVATHGLFIEPAVERLSDPAIGKIVVTDSIQLPPERRPPNLEVVSLADLLAQAIGRLHRRESISALFPPTPGIQPV